MRSSRSRHSSGLTGLWATEIEIGRPERSAIERRISNSPSTSMKSLTTCSTPLPIEPRASAMPISSSASAVSVGVSSPLLLRWLSVRDVVKPRAPACTASRARSAIAAMSSGVAGSRLRAALAHHVQAHRPVRHLGAEVEVAGPGVEVVEVLGERLPLPREALVEGDAGDVLDALHQLDQPVVVGRADRREADAAVAHHRRRDAVPARRGELVVPGRLAVVVGVDVDEARRHQGPVGVDLPPPGAGDGTDLGDDAAVDGDVGRPGRAPRAVDDAPERMTRS